MKIIINADDFGFSPKVNKTIYESAKSGYISSTTIMAVAPSLEEAVEMSDELDDISFGIHLVFDDSFPSLLGKPKDFDQNDIVNIRALNLLKVSIVTDEFSRQIEKLLNMGINISHIDTHHHIHLYPLVMIAVVKVANTYGIKKVRSQKLIDKKSWINRSYRHIHYKLTEAEGLIQPLFYTDFPTILGENIYNAKSNDIFEIMCHPGSSFNDEQYFNSTVYDTLKGSIINYHQLTKP